MLQDSPLPPPPPTLMYRPPPQDDSARPTGKASRSLRSGEPIRSVMIQPDPAFAQRETEPRRAGSSIPDSNADSCRFELVAAASEAAGHPPPSAYCSAPASSGSPSAPIGTPRFSATGHVAARPAKYCPWLFALVTWNVIGLKVVPQLL